MVASGQLLRLSEPGLEVAVMGEKDGMEEQMWTEAAGEIQVLREEQKRNLF